jgi:hypothetical protein
MFLNYESEQPRVHFETGQFMKRSRSPLRYLPRDFSHPSAPFQERFAQPEYGRPDYGRYEEEGYRHKRERDFRYSREDYDSRRNYFEAGPQYQDDYGRDDEGPVNYIQPDSFDFEQGEEEEEEVYVDEKEWSRQRQSKRPWLPSNRGQDEKRSEQQSEPKAGTSTEQDGAAKVPPPLVESSLSKPEKSRAPPPEEGNDSQEPLIVPWKVSELIAGWMTKGVTTEQSKAISKR